MKVSFLSVVAVSALVAAPSWAATIIVTNQSQFDAAVQQATQPGHADTIDATAAAGVIDAGSSLTLPGAAASVNLAFGTWGIGTTVGDGNVTLGAGTTVSFGQPNNPGVLNMGEGHTGVLTINGASLTFNVSDANEQFNVGLDDGTAIVNMTGGSVTMNDSNAVPGHYGSISVGYPFSSGGHPANGTFNQSGGTVSLSAGALNIGVADGKGTYNLSNDALLRLGGGTVYIGGTPEGVGVLNITGSATFDLESVGSGGQLYVGDDLGNGTITQNGANSTVILNIANIAQFGSDAENQADPGGTGTYNLLAGTLKIGSGGAAFGMDPGGFGFLNQGGGTLIATAPLIVGNAGTGTYNLGGGTANFGAGLTIAALTGSVGTVNQTGGLLTISGGSLKVGVAGTATYNLNGGVLQVGGANGIVGSGRLNLGGGTLQVVGSALTTDIAIGLTGTRSTVDTDGFDATFGGAMSGPGGFAKSGLGTLNLTAANSYTGGTAISGGTLRIGNHGTNGSIVGDVADNGTLAFSRSDDIAFGGAISGTGLVEQDGAGRLTLTGANSYAGGTALNAGTLVVGNAGAIGGGTLAMAAGTTLGFGGSFALANAITVSGDPVLDIGAGQTVTAGGVIANGTSPGDIVKAGDGRLILTAANSYTGGTTISGGTLQLGNGGTSGSIVGPVLDNGTLTFDRSDHIVFGGAISGTGSVVQAGPGTVTLSGDSSAFAGSTEVASGTLAVTGSLGGSLDVAAGATLAGTGTVGSTAIAGAVSPGGAGTIGTVTVAGSLRLAASTSYAVDGDAAGRSDLVHATGGADLGGATVSVLATGGWNVASRYTILTADGGISGRLAPSVVSDFAFLTPRLGYDADDVYLTLVRNGTAFASFAQTGNQRAAAGALDASAGGALYQSVVQLPAAKARSAFSQLSGEIHASAKGVLLDDSRFVRNAGIDRLRSAFGGVGASTQPVMTYAEADPARPDAAVVLAPAAVDRFAFWTQGFGSWGHRDGDGNAATLNYSTEGFIAGADAPVFDNWRIGLLGGYSRTVFNARDGAGSGSSDNYSLGVYGGRQWGALGLRLGAAYTWSDISTGRGVSFTGDTLSADDHAGTAQAFGELGYRIEAGRTPVGRLSFEPFAALAYVDVRTDGFTEQGGAAALSGQSDDTGVAFSALGLRASNGFTLGGLDLAASGTLGWRHAYGAVTPTSALRFAGSDAFTVAGVPIARDAAVVEAGLSTPITRSVSLGVSYTGQFGRRTQDQGVRGTLDWKF